MDRFERLAIEAECTRLINHYANLSDEGRWTELAGLFTEDAVFARPSSPDIPIRGRQAILDGFASRPALPGRRICANIVVTAESRDVATAFSVVAHYLGLGAPAGGLPINDTQPPLIGSFADRIVREGGDWRFAERRGELLFRRP